MMRCKQPQHRGLASISIVIVLLLLGLFTVGMVIHGARFQDQSLRGVESTRAFYAAEAGVNMALRELAMNADEDGDGGIGSIGDDGNPATDPNLLGATFRVEAVTADGTTTMTSRGTAGQSMRLIQMTANRQGGAMVAIGAATRGSLNVSGGSVDSFDSSLGPYGRDNMSDDAVLESGLDLPDVASLPQASWTILGDFRIDDSEVADLGTSDTPTHYRMGFLEVVGEAILNIHGNVTIRVDDDFVMYDGGEIRLIGNATLRIYVTNGDIEIEVGSKINANTGEPWRVVIYHLSGNSNFLINTGSEVYAILDAPRSRVEIDESAHVYGAVMARALALTKKSWLHHDLNPVLLEANPRLFTTESVDGSGAVQVTQWHELNPASLP